MLPSRRGIVTLILLARLFLPSWKGSPALRTITFVLGWSIISAPVCATSSPSPMKVIILAPTRSLSSYQHDHPSRNYNVIILVLKLKLEVEHTDGALHLTPRGATPPAAHSSLGKMLQNRDDCPPRMNTPAAHFILREGCSKLG